MHLRASERVSHTRIKRESWCKCIRRWDELGLANHTCGSVRKQSALRVKAQHLSQRHTVPEQGTWSPWGRPKSAPCHLLRVSLTLCLLHPFLLASPPPPAHPLLSPALLFRQQEKWHLLMENLCAWPPRKPELCLDHPRRLSINSCNHQSAKYFHFQGPSALYEMAWCDLWD